MPKPSRTVRLTEHRPDRRIKLTPEQREEICVAHSLGVSQRALAREYNVSRGLIRFIVNPEALVENRLRRQERGGWRYHYNREKHRQSMTQHRKEQDEIFRKKILGGK